MASVGQKDTKPELLVRRALHKLGYRFRLHVRELPGRPDIVLPKYGVVFEVKGCFWHNHFCPAARFPSTNLEYWVPKLIRNRERDASNERKLRQMGWSVHSLWECRLIRYSPQELANVLSRCLQG